MNFRSSAIGSSCTAVLFLSTATQGEELAVPRDITTAVSIPAQLESLSADEIPARTRFIEERLEAQLSGDQLWGWSWLGAFATGTTLQGIRAGMTGDRGKRADYVIGSAKAAVGVARSVLRPLPAKRGLDELRLMGEHTRKHQLWKLARAEQLLRDSALRAQERYSWKNHIFCAAFNLAGGLILWKGFNEPTRAALSAGLGFAMGELHIWSQPPDAVEHLAEYDRRTDTNHFTHAKATDRSWDRVQLQIGPAGAAIAVRF